MSGKKIHYVLRDAHANDYDFLERLYINTQKPLLIKLDAWNEPHLVARFKYLLKLAETRIISVEGVDVGWVQVSESEENIDLAQIHIEAPYRSRGIGSRLIRDLMASAEAQSKTMSLAVVRNNPARALYRRLGFQIVGEDDTKLHMRREPNPDRPNQQTEQR